MRKALDFSKVAAYSLDRYEPVVKAEQFARPLQENRSVRDYFQALSTCGSGQQFRNMIKILASMRRAGRPLLLGLGAGLIDEGMNSIIIDLINRSLITGIAMTGNAVFKDVEIAMSGGLLHTAGAGLETLLQSREAAEVINNGVNCGAKEDMGLGEALGAYLNGRNFEHGDKSILVAACTRGVPVTVHLTIGADTAHFLPTASGEAIGRTAHMDFRVFSAQVADMQGGAYINSGSSEILPQVFMKALLVGRALGYRIDDFHTVLLGSRLPAETGSEWRTVIQGENTPCICIDGPYGLLLPLTFTCLLDELSENC